jgi:hypothetical protein
MNFKDFKAGQWINCPMPGCNKPLKFNPFVCDNSGQ